MLIQLETHYSKPKPRRLFYSYSHKDATFRDELDTHLMVLKRDGFITTWDDREIRPGDEWDHEINDALNKAEVILFLVSPHFVASHYCRDIEVRRAMEKHRRKEALVVPIILKPVVFSSEEFASIQALPRNCRPLIEWPESGFASVAEDLRTLMIDLSFPQGPGLDPLGHHGSWILKLEARPEEDTQERADRIVSHLQALTSDYSISLRATSVTQVADGDKLATGLMLILTGKASSFTAIEAAHKEGTLNATIKDKALQFYIIHGATVVGESQVGTVADISEAEGRSLLLGVGKTMNPATLKGVTVRKGEGDEGALQFFFHRGDDGLYNSAARAVEYQKLVDYFKTCVAVPEELQWVNLSAYETDRMLPKELSGTALGRVLLAQDCMLKRLTASFMHPDNPVGRDYWTAVYAEARRRFGTSRMPFESFQKVWMIPSQARVYESDGDAFNQPNTVSQETDRLEGTLRDHYGLGPGKILAYILKSELDVQCETDFLARQVSVNSSRTSGANANGGESDFTLDLFRQIVLPQLKRELNEGEHFAEIRQVCTALVLATWLKKALPKIGNPRLTALADGRDPDSLRMSISSIQKVGSRNQATGDSSAGGDEGTSGVGPIDHATPFAPAFRIPENVEFYQAYINLFRNGVFRCARNEAGDEPGERIVRIYFSGAIDLTSLRATLEIGR